MKTKTCEPLEWQEAQELESLINGAGQTGQAVIVDPDAGITGTKAPALISPNENLNGQVRFGRHYKS